MEEEEGEEEGNGVVAEEVAFDLAAGGGDAQGERAGEGAEEEAGGGEACGGGVGEGGGEAAAGPEEKGEEE